MPSPLVHHAYQLNQFINNHLFPYFLYWDENSQKWTRETGRKRMIPYYILGYFMVDFFCMSTSMFIFLAAVFAPAALPFENAIMFILTSAVFPMSMVVDLIVFLYSTEILCLLNWLDELVVQRFPSTFEEEWSIGNARIFLAELDHFMAEEHTDWIGLLINFVVISYTNASIFMPLVLVWGNWDPIYLLAAILSSPEVNWLPDITSNIWLIFLRIPTTFLVAQAIFVNFKTFTIVITNLLLSVIKIMKTILERELGYPSIHEYKQLMLANNMILGTASIFFSQVLQAAFIGIVLGSNVIVLGTHLGSLPMMYVGAMAVVIAGFGACITFVSGCCWYEKSQEILHFWESSLIGNRDVKMFKRTVKSCRRLALRAGGVGILDDSIKNTFYHSALTYTANLLLATKNTR